MKKSIFCFFTSLVIIGNPLSIAQSVNDKTATWGNMAISEVKEKYPGIQVVDYLFIGRYSDLHSSKEMFKLWLKDGQREFGLYVEIEYNPDSNQIIKINFKEVPS